MESSERGGVATYGLGATVTIGSAKYTLSELVRSENGIWTSIAHKGTGKGSYLVKVYSLSQVSPNEGKIIGEFKEHLDSIEKSLEGKKDRKGNSIAKSIIFPLGIGQDRSEVWVARRYYPETIDKYYNETVKSGDEQVDKASLFKLLRMVADILDGLHEVAFHGHLDASNIAFVLGEKELEVKLVDLGLASFLAGHKANFAIMDDWLKSTPRLPNTVKNDHEWAPWVDMYSLACLYCALLSEDKDLSDLERAKKFNRVTWSDAEHEVLLRATDEDPLRRFNSHYGSCKDFIDDLERAASGSSGKKMPPGPNPSAVIGDLSSQPSVEELRDALNGLQQILSTSSRMLEEGLVNLEVNDQEGRKITVHHLVAESLNFRIDTLPIWPTLLESMGAARNKESRPGDLPTKFSDFKDYVQPVVDAIAAEAREKVKESISLYLKGIHEKCRAPGQNINQLSEAWVGSFVAILDRKNAELSKVDTARLDRWKSFNRAFNLSSDQYIESILEAASTLKQECGRLRAGDAYLGNQNILWNLEILYRYRDGLKTFLRKQIGDLVNMWQTDLMECLISDFQKMAHNMRELSTDTKLLQQVLGNK